MDYDIDAVRAAWIGRSLGTSQGRYPVEHEPIRRHCHMVGDTNPLFLDRDAARQGPYGAVIAPPTMLIMHFSSNGPWPPRERVVEETGGLRGRTTEATVVHVRGADTGRPRDQHGDLMGVPPPSGRR